MLFKMLSMQLSQTRTRLLTFLVIGIMVYIIYPKSRSESIQFQKQLSRQAVQQQEFFIDKDGNKVPVFTNDMLFSKPEGGYCNKTIIKDKEEYFQMVEKAEVQCKYLKKIAMYYICLDDFKKQNNCIVFSFGISFDFTYEDGLVDSLGCQAYSFDPTMDMEDHVRRNGSDKFFNLGLSSFKGVKTISYYKRLNRRCKVDRYVNIISMLGLVNAKIDFLKIDIEGSELDFFLDTASKHPELIQNIRQIQLEFHSMEKYYLHSGNRKNTSEFDLVAIIDILHCHGFVMVHTHWQLHGSHSIVYNGKKRSEWYITTWIRA